MIATARLATSMPDHELVITRVLDAPRSLVFKAWAEADHAARWWGPQGFTTLSCQMDVRPGGTWYRRMRAPDGALICKRGVYHEVVAPERLVFTYADENADGTSGHETLVTVSFAEHGGKTRLTLRQTGFELGGGTGRASRRLDELHGAIRRIPGAILRQRRPRWRSKP